MSTVQIVTCAVTSPFLSTNRSRRDRPPASAFRSVTRSGLVARRAGRRPNATPVATDSTRQNKSTRRRARQKGPAASRAASHESQERRCVCGDQPATQRAEEREQETLGEQLTDEARAGCPQRHPCGDLPSPVRRAAQEQIRHVPLAVRRTSTVKASATVKSLTAIVRSRGSICPAFQANPRSSPRPSDD